MNDRIETDSKGDCIPPNKTSYGTAPLETVNKNVAEFQSNVKRIGGLKDPETHFKNDGDTKGMLEAIERHVATSKRQVDAHHDSGTVCMMAGGAC